MTDCVGILLSGGAVVLVSDCDADMVNQHRWGVMSYKRKSGANFYALGPVIDGYRTTMHRFVMGMKKGDQRFVDHINGNGLDNRRENLRVATAGENHGNRRAFCNPIGYKGVYQRKGTKTFFAMLGYEYLGNHATAQEAANAYDAALISKYGEFAATNAALKSQREAAPIQPSRILMNAPFRPKNGWVHVPQWSGIVGAEAGKTCKPTDYPFVSIAPDCAAITLLVAA